jgi:hypothetical protein
MCGKLTALRGPLLGLVGSLVLSGALGCRTPRTPNTPPNSPPAPAPSEPTAVVAR